MTAHCRAVPQSHIPTNHNTAWGACERERGKGRERETETEREREEERGRERERERASAREKERGLFTAHWGAIVRNGRVEDPFLHHLLVHPDGTTPGVGSNGRT